jgi:hypothetical protein
MRICIYDNICLILLRMRNFAKKNRWK